MPRDLPLWPTACIVATVSAFAFGGCAHPMATHTAPAYAPPRWVGASTGGQHVLSLYDGSNAVGVHEVHADGGWRSHEVELPEPADAVVSLSRTTWVSLHGKSGTIRLAHLDGGRWERSEIHRLEPAPLQATAGDLDGDGRKDLVIVSNGPRPMLILLPGVAGGFGVPAVVPLNPRGRTAPSVHVCDVDGEGSLDVLVGLSTGTQSSPVPDHVRAFRNAAHGELVDEWMVQVRGPLHLHAADVDADGLPDILATGAHGAWLLPSAGFGWFEDAEQLRGGSIADGTLADIDADGLVDLVLLDAGRARFEVRRGIGSGRLGPSERYATGDGPVSMAVLPRPSGTLLVSANHADASFTTVKLRVSRSADRRSEG